MASNSEEITPYDGTAELQFTPSEDLSVGEEEITPEEAAEIAAVEKLLEDSDHENDKSYDLEELEAADNAKLGVETESDASFHPSQSESQPTDTQSACEDECVDHDACLADAAMLDKALQQQCGLKPCGTLEERIVALADVICEYYTDA